MTGKKLLVFENFKGKTESVFLGGERNWRRDSVVVLSLCKLTTFSCIDRFLLV